MAISNPTKYLGRVGNQYVGPQMWDPRGFWVIPDYGAKGQNLHVRPDGTTALVKTPGKAASATTGIVPAPSPAGQPAGPATRPVDAQYELDVAGLGRTRDTTIAGLGQQRFQTISDYGFTPVADPTTGVWGVGAFDPNNPYSKAALLKKSYDTRRAARAQQVQGFTGAYQNTQDALYAGQAQDEAQMRRALGDILTRNTGQVTQAGTDYGTGMQTAEA